MKEKLILVDGDLSVNRDHLQVLTKQEGSAAVITHSRATTAGPGDAWILKQQLSVGNGRNNQSSANRTNERSLVFIRRAQ